MPQFPAERFRAGAQFFMHTAAAVTTLTNIDYQTFNI